MIILGSKVKDKVSGMVGIAVTRLECLNGCTQYCVSPPIDKDGKKVDGWYIDEIQLEILEAPTTVCEAAHSAQSPGGPDRRA